VPQLGDRPSRLALDRLASAFDARLKADGISLREAARLLDLSPSTLTRVRQHQRPDAEALAVLMSWLDLGADDLVAAPRPPQHRRKRRRYRPLKELRENTSHR
jgi:transcriptional regulator with XRE-family HTH domain